MPESWTEPPCLPSTTKWIEHFACDAWEERYEAKWVEVLNIKNKAVNYKDANTKNKPTTVTTSSGYPKFRHRGSALNQHPRDDE
jgi:hypothetical protein